MPPSTAVTPGRLVREARRRAGLTQAQLAERLGWRQSSIAEVERDRKGITLGRLDRIAAALGVQLDELIPRATDRPRGSGDAR